MRATGVWSSVTIIGLAIRCSWVRHVVPLYPNGYELAVHCPSDLVLPVVTA
jgi:hypothetical protein